MQFDFFVIADCPVFLFVCIEFLSLKTVDTVRRSQFPDLPPSQHMMMTACRCSVEPDTDEGAKALLPRNLDLLIVANETQWVILGVYLLSLEAFDAIGGTEFANLAPGKTMAMISNGRVIQVKLNGTLK
jgi:hypothetical protein